MTDINAVELQKSGDYRHPVDMLDIGKPAWDNTGKYIGIIDDIKVDYDTGSAVNNAYFKLNDKVIRYPVANVWVPVPVRALKRKRGGQQIPPSSKKIKKKVGIPSSKKVDTSAMNIYLAIILLNINFKNVITISQPVVSSLLYPEPSSLPYQFPLRYQFRVRLPLRLLIPIIII